jgi:hypothetical protein
MFGIDPNWIIAACTIGPLLVGIIKWMTSMYDQAIEQTKQLVEMNTKLGRIRKRVSISKKVIEQHGVVLANHEVRIVKLEKDPE